MRWPSSLVEEAERERVLVHVTVVQPIVSCFAVGGEKAKELVSTRGLSLWLRLRLLALSLLLCSWWPLLNDRLLDLHIPISAVDSELYMMNHSHPVSSVPGNMAHFHDVFHLFYHLYIAIHVTFHCGHHHYVFIVIVCDVGEPLPGVTALVVAVVVGTVVLLLILAIRLIWLWQLVLLRLFQEYLQLLEALDTTEIHSHELAVEEPVNMFELIVACLLLEVLGHFLVSVE